jgi:hypothetical protein
MVPYHVVHQGEHLEQIAYRLGAAPDEVWGASQNQRLRALRGTGHVLAPGDVLWVPRRPVTEPQDVSVAASNQFTVAVPKTRIRLTLQSGGTALAGEPYRVVEAPDVSGRTDGQGRLEIELPVTLRRARLELTERRLVLPLVVGGLDPIHEVTGIQQRLLHLGHYAGPVDGQLGDATQAAIKRFQRARGAAASGMPDAATLDALSDAYGC